MDGIRADCSEKKENSEAILSDSNMEIYEAAQDLSKLNDENVSKKRCLKTPPIYVMDARDTFSHNSSNTLNQSSLSQVSNTHLLIPKLMLEPSFLNFIPYDELTRVISDFIFQKCVLESLKYIEIEVKIGQLVDLSTRERLRLPVLTETIINSDELKIKFESNMTESQHKYFNRFLNASFEKSQVKLKEGRTRIPMKYKHTKEIDRFYSNISLNQNFQNRIRVTTEKKTGQVISRLIKTRIASLNIFSPKTRFDWRISVNIEKPVEPQPLGVLIMERDKDRLSYVHQYCQIDLTQVISENGPKTHELEVELLNVDEIKRHGDAASHGQPNDFENIVRVFVDNVRILVRQNISDSH
ncbi:hypothetical protein PORY_000397 [Pneumocystis oryctolagi]|uniref:Uncharacterized protein n=1 Tax=Pneumocystis oryctolagi TaxID=42067 RepID=A0ACB7CJH4_9ASCO|nr:hypothetical protein PORY_000397 [Pneumocystis oryctolagi]